MKEWTSVTWLNLPLLKDPRVSQCLEDVPVKLLLWKIPPAVRAKSPRDYFHPAPF